MSNAKDKTIIIGNFDGVHLGHQKLINLGKKILSLPTTSSLFIGAKIGPLYSIIPFTYFFCAFLLPLQLTLYPQ